MKPLKYAMTALVLVTAGAAGAQTVSTDTDVSAGAGVTGGEPTGIDTEVTADSDTGVTAEDDGAMTADSDTGVAVEGDSEMTAESEIDAAEGDSLTVATQDGSTATSEGSVKLEEGTEIMGRDGVTIGAVAGVVDEAKGLVRVDLDEGLQTQVPSVVLSAQSLTAVDRHVTVPMTGAEFAAAVEQLTNDRSTATN